MPWFCVYCGDERDLAEFGKQSCRCGAHAMTTTAPLVRVETDTYSAFEVKLPEGIPEGEVARVTTDLDEGTAEITLDPLDSRRRPPWIPYPETIKSNEWNHG